MARQRRAAGRTYGLLLLLLLQQLLLGAVAVVALAHEDTDTTTTTFTRGTTRLSEPAQLLWLDNNNHRWLEQTNVFADSQNTYYSGYQQAWRMLGVYVDCSAVTKNDEHDDHDANKPYACQRYILWAAYVDPSYQGGSASEYQYWSPDTGTWDVTACEADNNARCAKMDCHNTDTETWQLLGIFKEAAYASEWFEQLFKHAGYCLWSGDTYEFMHNYYADWPEACTATESTTKAGDPLYLDLKPGQSLTFALYTDNICKTEYVPAEDDDSVDIDTVVKQAGYLYSDSLALFNANMQVYKYCQPCRALNLGSGGADGKRNRKLDDNGNGMFACNDAAGYTNVNQCMKFRTHTTMVAATMNDVSTALQQGAILDIKLGDRTYVSPVKEQQLLLLATATGTATAADEQATQMSTSSSSSTKGKWLLYSSIISLSVSLLAFWIVLAWKFQRRRIRRFRLKEPLVPSPYSVSS